ncbi:MAG: flagellar biosynthesis protein FlgM [Campylobacteraceae bacterium 4484_4]|nr:MAG: flagellar biosynthesis protein FlgM [Campylobacteraceae bacterium 4484_4]
MRWENDRRSDNIEDRRGGRVKKVVGGGIGSILIVLAALYLGVDPSALLQQTSAPTTQQQKVPVNPEEEKEKEFVSVVLADTEDVWHQVFREMGRTYKEPKLVLFSGQVRSACGYAQAAMGPFYCPADQKVYIDLSFYDELKRKYGASGDFAQAYIIAHEIGHHVQNLLGITQRAQRMQARSSRAGANKISVKVELQADCLAGVWANRAHKQKRILERGDIDEALNAAYVIGDDRLQKQARGYVVPDSFTHGSSKQRMYWFTRGLKSGDINQCDTFTALR